MSDALPVASAPEALIEVPRDVVERAFLGYEIDLERLEDDLLRGRGALDAMHLNNDLAESRSRMAQQAPALERAAAQDNATQLAAAKATIVELREKIRKLTDQVADLQERNAVDPLTGVLNRAGLEKVLNDEWLRGRRATSPLGFIFVDLDNFKHINDDFGHPAGDEVLKAVAKAIEREAKRSGEAVGRYGGDEFVVVVPQSDLSVTLGLGERIRETVNALVISQGDQELPITVSVGAASVVPSVRTQPEYLVKRADRAVYRAKESGRNRAVGVDVEGERDVAYSAQHAPTKEATPAKQPSVFAPRSRR